MPRLKFLTNISLAFVVTAVQIIPAAQVFAQKNLPDALNARQQMPVVSSMAADLPPFPEDLNRPAVDWSSIDWEEKIILEKDRQAYQEEFEQLFLDNKLSEARALKPKTTKRFDEEALLYYNIPSPVRDVIREYRDGVMRAPKNCIRRK